MFFRHLQIALRLLRRNRLNSFINILGLSLSVVCCLLLYAFLRHEWTWDRTNQNIDRIHLIRTEFSQDIAIQAIKASSDRTSAPSPDAQVIRSSPLLLHDTIQDQIPGIEAITPYDYFTQLLKKDNEIFKSKVGYSNPSLFDIFTLPLVEGKQNLLLIDLHGAIVTESFARKYFVGDSFIGKSFDVKLGGEFIPVEITAVIEDLPENNTLSDIEIFLPFETYRKYIIANDGPLSWGRLSINNYILAEEGISPQEISNSINEYLINSEVQFSETNLFSLRFHAHPLKTLQVCPPYLANPEGLESKSDMSSAKTLFIIAMIILALACINVTSLSIGRGALRANEIGVRKVLGANKKELMFQFWLETGLTVLFAIAVGLVLTELILPVVRNLVEVDLAIFYDITTIISLASLWFILVVASGTYPALVMASFPTLSAFKGFLNIGRNTKLRRVLLVVQFTLSIALIAITMNMSSQMRYMQSVDLGYNGDQVVSLPIYSEEGTGARMMKMFQERFSGEPGILNITGTSSTFGDPLIGLWWQENEKEKSAGVNIVDFNYISMMDIQIVAGRDFSQENAADGHNSIIVNEAFVKEFGIEDPIGHQKANFNGKEIIGVVKDYHFNSLEDEISPMIFTVNPSLDFIDDKGYSTIHHESIQYILLKLSSENIPETMKTVEGYWKEIASDWQYKYKFIDDNIQEQYSDTRMWNKVSTLTSILAILIASMGLFGLAEIQISQRIKEIGIRKVLGASVWQIVSYFNKEFIILVSISSIIAMPIAFFVLKDWLENFAYKLPVNPLILISAGLMAMMIALITTSSQAIRAANTNPSEILRSE